MNQRAGRDVSQRQVVAGLDVGVGTRLDGVDRVISAKSETLAPRRPGVVGLYLRIAMSAISSRLLVSALRRRSEQIDRLAAGGQRHDRSLGVLALSVAGAGALALTRTVRG